jgi:hypothetical protein
MFLLFTFLFHLLDPSPQPFRPVSHERHPPAYYARQAELWQQVAEDDCGSDRDWLQYFFYARYANRFAEGAYDLEAITAAAAASVDPDGFPIHYIRYMQADMDTRYDHLRRAYAADSLNVYGQSSRLTLAKLTGDPELVRQTTERLARLLPYPPALMDYAHNTLESVSPEGILLVFGDADTYPVWVMQDRFGVRPDVLAVNYYLLLRFPDYAERIFQELDLSTAPITGGPELIDRLRQSSRPLHLAATAGELIEDIRSEVAGVYPVGLTFQLSNTPIDNGGINRRLYWEVWRLDAVRRSFADDAAARAGNQFEPNYLVPLLSLRDILPGVDTLIQTIAVRNGLTEQVDRLLNPAMDEPDLASDKPGVSFRKLGLRYRNGGEFAYQMAATEVSNADYQLFLEDLLRQRKFDYLDTAAVRPTDWRSLLPDSLAALPDAELYSAGHPKSDNHPVVNISHRAAELYAIWLTQAYNRDPKRQDDRRVRFRLPTATEFERAARGGHKNAPYPWGGPYYYNAKGCILANLNVALIGDSYPAGYFQGTSSGRNRRERPDFDCKLDGSYLTAAVEAYFPNNYGLYNMAGNAAEMTDTDGQTMGGSWLDGPEALKNGVVTERQLPSPTTGFRLVMEYVEE